MPCVSRRLVLAALALSGSARAHADTILWRAVTEYPANAMPGEGLTRFAALLAAADGGALAVAPRFDGPDGLRSATIPEAVAQGRAEIGDAFAGALGAIDPLFQLSSLPFLATDTDAARRLAVLARPAYERALGRLDLHLLYITPWPASGLWSRDPLAGPADLQNLAVRTYDPVSTAVLRAAGAEARQLSFADAAPEIAAGRIAAVLSSGDGGAGQRLWRFLPHFCAIFYAAPLSFTVAAAPVLAALPPPLRAAVAQAARETEAQQWAALADRDAANTAAMRANGVAIAAASPALRAALVAAAAPQITGWARAAGPEAATLLAAFRQ